MGFAVLASADSVRCWAAGDVEKDFWLAFDLLRSHKDHEEFTVVRDWVQQVRGPGSSSSGGGGSSSGSRAIAAAALPLPLRSISHGGPSAAWLPAIWRAGLATRCICTADSL
jgi:hypothetical protein